MAVSLDKALRSIAEYAGRYGLKPSLDEEKGIVVIEHSEYPLRVVVEPRGGVYAVELLVGEEIDESVEELLGEDVDPREELEDVIETMIQVVDYAVRKLEEAGQKVERLTREAILDIYDAIESFVEEEEE